jgi:integrase
MPRKPVTPSLRRHKTWGLGVVTLNGKDRYLGRWPEGEKDPPPDVQAEYDRVIAEWLASGRGRAQPPQERAAGPTVEELLAAFWAHAEEHYRHPDGRPTSELREYAPSLRPLRHLYAALPARDFSPSKLKAVRELMVQGYDHPKYGPQLPLSRGVVNQRVRRIIRAFKWAVGEELAPVEVYQSLKAVPGLQKGRSKARETEPVKPVDPAVVQKTLPHLQVATAGMVRLQLVTGMRPGEVCGLRLADLDRSGPVWLYRPAAHKTAWKGKERVVAIGPKGQAVILDFVRLRCPLCGVEGRPPRIGCRDGALCGPCADRTDEAGVCGPWKRCEVQPADAYLFSPRLAMLERDEDRRAKRKSKVQPSQRWRRKKSPAVKPRDAYDRHSYGQAVARACEKAGVPHWHPNQLRHTHATEVRRRYGLEAAQVALGHSQANVTQVYAERDLALAARVASEMG